MQWLVRFLVPLMAREGAYAPCWPIRQVSWGYQWESMQEEVRVARVDGESDGFAAEYRREVLTGADHRFPPSNLSTFHSEPINTAEFASDPFGFECANAELQ